jgi:hypothetical protein
MRGELDKQMCLPPPPLQPCLPHAPIELCFDSLLLFALSVVGYGRHAERPVG